MDTACSSKTISATHSLLPNSVNSAFLRRSMCVVLFFFLLFTGVSFWGGGGEMGLLFNLGWGGQGEMVTVFQIHVQHLFFFSFSFLFSFFKEENNLFLHKKPQVLVTELGGQGH